MCAIFRIEEPLIQQPQVSLVDQSCALKAAPGTLSLELIPRDVAQFVVDERNQHFQRFFVAHSAPATRLQDANVVDSRSVTTPSTMTQR